MYMTLSSVKSIQILNKLKTIGEKAMNHYDTSFFCDTEQGPKVFVDVDKECTDKDRWPVILRLSIKGDRLTHPSVTFYLKSMADLMAFKHSVISAVSRVVEVKDV
jgi:hypothetical protein